MQTTATYVYIPCIPFFWTRVLFLQNFRTYFGAQRIEKRLSDSSDNDEDEGDKLTSPVSKPTRRKATDILAEVSISKKILPWNLEKMSIISAFKNWKVWHVSFLTLVNPQILYHSDLFNAYSCFITDCFFMSCEKPGHKRSIVKFSSNIQTALL